MADASIIELLDDMQLGSTEFKNKLTKQRIFQGEITRSIEKMNGIKSCRVQLADPERSIFEDKDEGGICIILSRSSWIYDMFRFIRCLVRTSKRRKRNMDFRYVRRCKRDSAS